VAAYWFERDWSSALSLQQYEYPSHHQDELPLDRMYMPFLQISMGVFIAHINTTHSFVHLAKDCPCAAGLAGIS